MDDKVIDNRFYKRMEEWGIDAKTIKKCINKHMSKKSKSSLKSGVLNLSADKVIKPKTIESKDTRDETIRLINNILMLKDSDKQPSVKESKNKANKKIDKPKLGRIPSESFYTGEVTRKKGNKRK